MRLSKVAATVAVLSLAAGAAQANVVYNWTPTAPGQYAQSTSGQLIVSDTAYKSGSLSVDDAFFRDVAVYGGPFGDRVLNSPLASASMAFLYDGQQKASASAAPSQDGFASGGDQVSATLAFLDNGLLSGTLDITSESDNFDSSGNGSDWSIFNLNSDYFSGDGHCVGEETSGGGCSAGTGYWKLSSSSVNDVPAPNGLALFMLGALGTLSLAWRRRRSV